MFPGRLISKRGDIPWPARFPDWTPCDFFLWRYMKSEVHKHRLRNLEALKKTIHTKIHRIPQEMLEKVMQNFLFRLEQYIDFNENHLTEI